MLTKVRYVLFQKPCLAFQLIPPQITWEDHWDINKTQAGPYAHAVAHQHLNEEEPIKAQRHQQTVLALAFVSTVLQNGQPLLRADVFCD